MQTMADWLLECASLQHTVCNKPPEELSAGFKQRVHCTCACRHEVIGLIEVVPAQVLKLLDPSLVAAEIGMAVNTTKLDAQQRL